MDSWGEQEFSQIIEKSLTAILSGESTLEAILARYPEQTQELRAELEAALWLVSRRDEVSSRAGFVRASRKRLVGRIKAESHAGNGKRASLGLILPRRFVLQFASAMTIFILLFISTFGAVSASYSALPGESFYAIKRLTEDVQYTFTLDATSRAQLSLEFSRRRLFEVEVLIARGEYEAVAQTLNDFEYKVNQSVTLLQEENAAGDSELDALAESLQAQLSRHTEQLTYLLQIAPDSALNGLQRAMEVSQHGQQTADEMRQKERPNQSPDDSLPSPVTKTVGSSNQNNQPVKTAFSPGGHKDLDPAGMATRTPRPMPETKPDKTDKPLPESKPEKPTKDEGTSNNASPPIEIPVDKPTKEEGSNISDSSPPITPPGLEKPTNENRSNKDK